MFQSPACIRADHLDSTKILHFSSYSVVCTKGDGDQEKGEEIVEEGEEEEEGEEAEEGKEEEEEEEEEE